MEDSEKLILLEEIGKINIVLLRLGVSPKVKQSTETIEGKVMHCVLLTQHDGFTRSTIEAGGKSERSTEHAYFIALKYLLSTFMLDTVGDKNENE